MCIFRQGNWKCGNKRETEEGRAEGARKRLIGQAIMANVYEGGDPGKGHVESRPALKCRGS